MFANRSNELEIMDNLELGGEAMGTTLKEITFINKWLGGNAVTTNGILLLLKQKKSNFSPETPLKIADLGCGGGDMLKIMADWLMKNQLPARLTGIDANDYIIQYALQNTTQYPEILYENLNIFSENFRELSFDIVTCTLFCHHFTDQELIDVFLHLKSQAKTGIVINDLHRNPFAYYSISWLTKLFSHSYLVKNDARLSVLRGFKRKELMEILKQAGILNYQIKWCWAFRWQIVIFAD